MTPIQMLIVCTETDLKQKDNWRILDKERILDRERIHVSSLPLVSATLQYSLRKSLGFYRQWYRVFGNRVAFFHFISEEKINGRVDQNPVATGTVGLIKI